MPTTYEPIATTTLGSAQSSVTFSTISGSYTDLIFVVNAGASTAVNLWLEVNSDTGSNYSVTRLSGNGTSASSDRKSSATKFEMTAQSYVADAIEFNAIVSFQNYSNSTTYKTIIGRMNLAAGGTDAVVGLWRSTSAITTIVAKTSSGTFDSGSTFTLYGIKAA
jgi:hypothetical protein